MQNYKYTLPARIIHWLMAIIIISLLAIGFYMTNFLDKQSVYRGTIYGLHKSFGALVIFLIIFRIFIRLKNSPPKLPQSINIVIQKLAIFVHYLLYFLMIFMPLSGYLMSNYYGYPVVLFGLPLPNLTEKNPELGHFFGETHEFLAIVFAATLSLHIIGSIKHRFFDKTENNVLKRML